ncbi:MAG: hypothetical protein U0800_03205 [Isosphaeraceae bacterium]
MGKLRKSADGGPGAEKLVQLRFNDPIGVDWAHASEGALLLYDPEVVTDEVFREFSGDVGGLVAGALDWMASQPPALRGYSPYPHACTQRHSQLSRAEVARRLGRCVQLGWEGSLAMLPFAVDMNGMDIRFRSAGLTQDEKRVQQASGRVKKGLTTLRCPGATFIAPRGPRLAVTWSWSLRFTPEEKKKYFGPGSQVEFAWPPGEYLARAWEFDDAEDEDGEVCLGQLVVQLIPLSEVEADPEE